MHCTLDTTLLMGSRLWNIIKMCKLTIMIIMLITNRQSERFINRFIHKYLNTQPSYSLKQTKLFENGERKKSYGSYADCDCDCDVESCVWAVSAREYTCVCVSVLFACVLVCDLLLAAVNWNKKLFVYFKISKSNQNENDYSSERPRSTRSLHCSLPSLDH